MPGQHKTNEKLIGLWLDIEVLARLERACATQNKTKVAFITELILEATANIVLSEEDKRRITEHYAKNTKILERPD